MTDKNLPNTNVNAPVEVEPGVVYGLPHGRALHITHDGCAVVVNADATTSYIDADLIKERTAYAIGKQTEDVANTVAPKHIFIDGGVDIKLIDLEPGLFVVSYGGVWYSVIRFYAKGLQFALMSNPCETYTVEATEITLQSLLSGFQDLREIAGMTADQLAIEVVDSSETEELEAGLGVSEPNANTIEKPAALIQYNTDLRDIKDMTLQHNKPLNTTVLRSTDLLKDLSAGAHRYTGKYLVIDFTANEHGELVDISAVPESGHYKVGELSPICTRFKFSDDSTLLTLEFIVLALMNHRTIAANSTLVSSLETGLYATIHKDQLYYYEISKEHQSAVVMFDLQTNERVIFNSAYRFTKEANGLVLGDFIDQVQKSSDPVVLKGLGVEIMSDGDSNMTRSQMNNSRTQRKEELERDLAKSLHEIHSYQTNPAIDPSQQLVNDRYNTMYQRHKDYPNSLNQPSMASAPGQHHYVPPYSPYGMGPAPVGMGMSPQQYGYQQQMMHHQQDFFQHQQQEMMQQQQRHREPRDGFNPTITPNMPRQYQYPFGLPVVNSAYTPNNYVGTLIGQVKYKANYHTLRDLLPFISSAMVHRINTDYQREFMDEILPLWVHPIDGTPGPVSQILNAWDGNNYLASLTASLNAMMTELGSLKSIGQSVMKNISLMDQIRPVDANLSRQLREIVADNNLLYCDIQSIEALITKFISELNPTN